MSCLTTKVIALAACCCLCICILANRQGRAKRYSVPWARVTLVAEPENPSSIHRSPPGGRELSPTNCPLTFTNTAHAHASARQQWHTPPLKTTTPAPRTPSSDATPHGQDSIPITSPPSLGSLSKREGRHPVGHHLLQQDPACGVGAVRVAVPSVLQSCCLIRGSEQDIVGPLAHTGPKFELQH